jgi:hypothetical protein
MRNRLPRDILHLCQVVEVILGHIDVVLMQVRWA